MLIIFYQLSIMHHEDCLSRYGSRVVTDQTLCATTNSEGSCQIDSGGLLVVRSSDGSYSLAGIYSLGMISSSHDNIGIFTNITAVSEWLAKNMNV